MLRAMAHPATGAASAVGAVLHYALAQELAERFVQLADRVKESSRRAHALAKLFVRAGLSVHYPLVSGHPSSAELSQLDGELLGGGVFSVAFSSEEEGARFLDRAKDMIIHDWLLGEMPLIIPAVSLGSTHTYGWVTTEARAQGKVVKWPALPFKPIPYGFIRIAVGYAGCRALQFTAFENALRALDYTIAPEPDYFHT